MLLNTLGLLLGNKWWPQLHFDKGLRQFLHPNKKTTVLVELLENLCSILSFNANYCQNQGFKLKKKKNFFPKKKIIYTVLYNPLITLLMSWRKSKIFSYSCNLLLNYNNLQNNKMKGLLYDVPILEEHSVILYIFKSDIKRTSLVTLEMFVGTILSCQGRLRDLQMSLK